jgi:hypothetical protein
MALTAVVKLGFKPVLDGKNGSDSEPVQLGRALVTVRKSV